MSGVCTQHIFQVLNQFKLPPYTTLQKVDAFSGINSSVFFGDLKRYTGKILETSHFCKGYNFKWEIKHRRTQGVRTTLATTFLLRQEIMTKS